MIIAGLVFAASHMAPLASIAWYSDRFMNRSLAAFRIRKRYAFGSSVTVGYALPLTTGVSMNASMPMELYGVLGMSRGSHHVVSGSHVGSKYGLSMGG